MGNITRWKVSGPDTRLQPDADGPWVALVDYYRVTDRLIAERDAAQARLRDYDDRLSAVMPSDCKSWHENSREEWPEVAAATIKTMRTQEREAWSMVSRVSQKLEHTRAEVTRLATGRNAAWAEVERLRAEVERLTTERDRERLIETLTEVHPMPWVHEERLTQERDAAQAEVERLRAELEESKNWTLAAAQMFGQPAAQTQTKTPVVTEAPVDLRQLRERLLAIPSHELSLEGLRRAVCRVLDVLS